MPLTTVPAVHLEGPQDPWEKVMTLTQAKSLSQHSSSLKREHVHRSSLTTECSGLTTGSEW